MTTVQELIEFLQSQPQDLRVLIENENYMWGYDDFNLDDVAIKYVVIKNDGMSHGGSYGGRYDKVCQKLVVVYNEFTKQQETCIEHLYKEWQRVRSFTDANVLPCHGGEWAWSNGENRWVRLSPPEPVKPKPIPWPVEKALLLS